MTAMSSACPLGARAVPGVSLGVAVVVAAAGVAALLGVGDSVCEGVAGAAAAAAAEYCM